MPADTLPARAAREPAQPSDGGNGWRTLIADRPELGPLYPTSHPTTERQGDDTETRDRLRRPLNAACPRQRHSFRCRGRRRSSPHPLHRSRWLHP